MQPAGVPCCLDIISPCGNAGVNTNGNSKQMLTHGQSLPSVTPRPPPGGMVLPNAFGLMSMKSFTRSNSSKTPSTQVQQRASLELVADHHMRS